VSEIRVLFQQLNNYSADNKNMSKKVSNIQRELNSLKDSLDWDVKSCSSINSILNGLYRDIESYSGLLSKMSNYLATAYTEYMKCENELTDAANETDKENWFDKVLGAAASASKPFATWIEKGFDWFEEKCSLIVAGVGLTVEKVGLAEPETGGLSTAGVIGVASLDVLEGAGINQLQNKLLDKMGIK
jgi:hypothetical protein